MKARSVSRAEASPETLVGAILCRDVPVEGGFVRKGAPLDAEDVRRLESGTWTALHVADLEAGELLEGPAGERIARAAAGEGVEVGSFSGGYWPITARERGILHVDAGRLLDLNRVEGVAVCTLFDGHVVDRGELLARVKVVPFALAEASVERAEHAAEPDLLWVRPVQARRVGAVAVESLSEKAARRFEDSLAEKLTWLGSELLPVRYVEPSAEAIGTTLESLVGAGAELILVAGSKGMDPLDPALLALEREGADLVRSGAPVFPGTLLWLARMGDVPIIGLPSCGIFSQATVIDILLPRLLIEGMPEVDDLIGLGHGGLLRPELSYRLPGYRPKGGRGGI